MNLQEKKDFIYKIWLDRCKEFPWLETNTIFLSIHGSTCYGLDTETSDVDFTGVAVPPKEYHLGWLHQVDQIQFTQDLHGADGQIYNIKKFFKLAADNNPNVMELLWIDPKYHIDGSLDWLVIQCNRNSFLSKKARYTYAGYATAQLSRIKLHRRWLLEPITKRPTREEFGLSPERILSRDQQGALDLLVDEHKIQLDDNFMKQLQQENEYDRAVKNWESYQNWFKTRNPKRAELERNFGYDTKCSLHLFRLSRQAKEILTEHTIRVERLEDREELLNIRNGSLTYSQLMEKLNNEASDAILDKLYEETTLPHHANFNKLNEICVNIVEKYIKM